MTRLCFNKKRSYPRCTSIDADLLLVSVLTDKYLTIICINQVVVKAIRTLCCKVHCFQCVLVQSTCMFLTWAQSCSDICHVRSSHCSIISLSCKTVTSNYYVCGLFVSVAIWCLKLFCFRVVKRRVQCCEHCANRPCIRLCVYSYL